MDKKTATLPKKTATLGKKGSRLNAPDIDSLFDPAGLPGLPPIDETDTEAIANREVADMMTLIRENRKNNAERFRDIESGEFWFCVCFQSRSQKEAFVQKLLDTFAPHWNIEHFGDKYISGLELAEMLGIPITPIALEVKKNRLAPKSLRGREVID
jgi:hypothetical protein